MESSVQKKVTVGLEMDLEELRVLNNMLLDWAHDIGQKLPDGATEEQRQIIMDIGDTYRRASL